VALKRDPGVNHLAWMDIFKQANLFVTLTRCSSADAIYFMAPLYPKHNAVTPCGWIKRGEDHEVRDNARRPRLNVNDITDLDCLAPVVPFDETRNANAPRSLLRQFARLNLEATQGSGHRLADRICLPRRFSASLPSTVASMALWLCFSLLAAGCGPQLATKAENVTHMPNPLFNAAYSEDADVPFVMEPKRAMTHGSGRDLFQSESASRRTRDMADWVVSSRDNLNMPFAIIDKVNATVYVFGADGQFYGAAPVLLGLAKGDHSLPGIGKMPMSSIPPSERTTPAGRFVTQMGRDPKGKETLWLDYEGALSMHAVIKGTARDRRAERLASPSALDNRISFGCINVPVPFFHNVIATKFSDTAGIVYILPETKQFGKS
jgi:hypothetical protein